MNQVKEERGYALILVLFLIVFIVTITAVFMRGSISNAKQENIVNSNHLSYVASEMGVDYFKNKFLNQYYEVRNDIWTKRSNEYKLIVEDKDFSGDAIAISKIFQGLIRTDIKNSLEEINDGTFPEDVYFSVANNKFVICMNQKTEERGYKCDYENAILIAGDVIGEYVDGTEAKLEMSLLLKIPELINIDKEEETNTDSENSSNDVVIEKYKFNRLLEKDLEIKNVEKISPIQSMIVNKNSANYKKNENFYRIPSLNILRDSNIELGQIQESRNYVQIKSEGDISTTKYYDNDNLDIQANGNITTGQIQLNKGNTKMLSKGNFVATANMTANNNVEISTDSNFESKLIQDNTGYLKIIAKGGIKIGGSDNNNNLWNNRDVSLLTNGNLEVNGQIGKNLDFVNIQSSGNFKSGIIQENGKTNIQSNGSFESAKIRVNKNGVDIKSKGNFKSNEIEENIDVNINTFGNFESASIYKNTGKTAINSLGDFKVISKIQENENMKVRTNDNFYAHDLYGNKAIELISIGNFEIEDHIDSNQDISIFSKGKIDVDGRIYGNENMEIYTDSELEVESNMQANEDVKIYAKNKIDIDGELYGNKRITLYTDGELDIDKKIQDNEDLIIYAKKEIELDGNIYGNRRIQIFTEGDFEGENIQNNISLKIIANGDFKAKRIELEDDSMICVGGEFEYDHLILKGNSAIYMKQASKGVNDKITYLNAKDWVAKCSINVGQTAGDGPIINETIAWPPPIIDVKYPSK